MNLYGLNKVLVNQLNPLTKEELFDKEKVFINLHKKFANKHYMLLCKEYNYYTIFEEERIIMNKPFSDTVIEIITELGEVYSIEPTEDNDAIEIWIKIPKLILSETDLEEDTPMVFYLFPYDMGVVKFE